MDIKIYDSELKVMETVWTEGDLTAKRIAEILNDEIGWSKTTTYTVIKKCITKGLLEKRMPNFLCHALITKEVAQKSATNELIHKLYNGKEDFLIASLLGVQTLSEESLCKLKKMVNEIK